MLPEASVFCTFASMNSLIAEDTIVALSTPPGKGALAVIRISGPRALTIAAAICPKAKVLHQPSHTARFVRIYANGLVLDEAVLTIFRAPKSFTREDVVELSCHGSPYIIQETLHLILSKGARMANPGEFTFRAYLNGTMDLAQAEAVADLISSESRLAHNLAMNQMRGGFSDQLKALRLQMLDFAALVELELDFSEEDVEFADRTRLRAFVLQMQVEIQTLAKSFSLGNAILHGIPTAIIGKPNAGKSTLLNALLNDSRAIVSEIAGTTRDVIEDRLFLKGAEFRLMDTAGLRETTDSIEQQGISRSWNAIEKARVILLVFDASADAPADMLTWVEKELIPRKNPEAGVLLIANKVDLLSDVEFHSSIFPLSALNRSGLDKLEEAMIQAAGILENQGTLVSSARHQQALLQTNEYLTRVLHAIDTQLGTELLAEEMRAAMYELGSITGDISNEEVLGNIFGKFCIGK
jgi:tRNA modification GTPase